jgi:hypothetical protein
VVALKRSGALALLAVIVLGGCAGSDTEERTFTAADAKRIAAVRPVTPGWSAWPQSPEKPRRSNKSPAELAAEDPIYAAYRARTLEIGEGLDEGNRWRDDDKLANLVVSVLDTPVDAEVVFDASNDLARGYAERYGYVTKAEEVDGLGDQGWVLLVSSNARGATYHWRRANLVIEAHVDCHGACPWDVEPAARAWADAIDAEARDLQ